MVNLQSSIFNHPSIRQITAAIIGLFIVIGFLVYGYSICTNDFVEFDDTLLIVNNLSVIQAGRLSSVLWAFGHYDPELYIPLTFLSFQFDAVLGGLNPWIFHLDNLLQHIGNSLLVTWILHILCKRIDIAVLLGLLFLVHPLNTEAVAWASGRKDLLSTLFMFASIVAYLRYRTLDTAKFYWVSLGLFLLALLAKVSVAPLPIVLLIIDWLQQRSVSLQSFWQKKGFFLVALLVGIIAILGKDMVFARSSPTSILLLIPRTILFYAQKMIYPVHLSILYPYAEESVHFANPAIVISIIACFAAAVGMWIIRHRQPMVFAGAAIAIALLSSSFLQYYRGAQLYLATDRYMYMSFLGVCIMLVPIMQWAIDRWQRTTYCVSGLILIICSVLSFQRSRVWENTYTLFTDSLKTAESVGAYEKVGAWLLRQGPEHRTEALAALRRSIELSPNSAAYFRLGVAAIETGNIEDAKLFTLESLRLSPENPQAHTNISMLYWDEGNIAKAIEHAELAVEHHPWSEMALGNLASMYTLSGEKEKALVIIDQLLDVYPNHERVGPLMRKLEEM